MLNRNTNIVNADFLKTATFTPCKNPIPLLAPLALCGIAAAGVVRAFRPELGCNYNHKTKDLNFAVASKNATHINLYIFDKPVNGKVISTVEMKKQGSNWVTKLDKSSQDKMGLDVEANKPLYYGYRAWGPNWEYDPNWQPGSGLGFMSHVDKKGNRFNPNKLLTDPYAKELSHDPISPQVQGRYIDERYYATGNDNYLTDTAELSPKGVFVYQKQVSTGEKPQRAIKDDVIYETHLRGFSMLDEKIPEKYRGTYKGAAMKAKYLKQLGVTMVEFLPVHEFDDDKNELDDIKNKNYWGYQTLNFFSPNRRYAYDKSAGGPTKEFQEMVKAFHDEGIKVCLDVVYNHTGEGGTWGNKDVTTMYSMKGLDSRSYYESTQDNQSFWDNSGCGANMNSANPLTSDLISNSLKYWSEDMGVDAFRFDLAPVLVNTVEKSTYRDDWKREEGFYYDSQKSPVLDKIGKKLDIRTDDGTKGSVDLIAEPWACGDGTYRVGQFPTTWKEWNDGFRNVIRGLFNRQEKTSMSEIARAIAGSSDKFQGDKTRSVNFITCHDGFTMKDLFSYNNPYNNNPNFFADGGTSGEGNISWDNFNDFKRQIKAMKNAFATLLVSKGIPMISGGDEIMKTQMGNNNAYCLDSKQNYINWNLDKEQKNMQEFVKKATAFRHAHPALKDLKFFEGKDHNNNGLKDVTWMRPDSSEADGAYLDNPENIFLGCRIDGTEYSDSAASIYTVINKGDWDVNMTLPKNLDGKQWYLVADTADESEIDGNFAKQGKEVKVGQNYVSSPRSTMIFIEK